MLHLVTHGHDDAAATSPTSTAVLTRPRSGVDLRVDYAAGCATAEIAQQRRTGRSGATAARPRHRRRVSGTGQRVGSAPDARLTSASTALSGALPPRLPCCGAVAG